MAVVEVRLDVEVAAAVDVEVQPVVDPPFWSSENSSITDGTGTSTRGSRWSARGFFDRSHAHRLSFSFALLVLTCLLDDQLLNRHEPRRAALVAFRIRLVSLGDVDRLLGRPGEDTGRPDM